jgi:8-oxo-dGTP pyrophosphatase MutT (NUDIX family)
MKTVQHRSAGGLVVRGSQILLISTQSGRRWQLPKGHIEEGETSEQTAVREVREETGVTSRVVAPLPGVDYCLMDYVSADAADFDAQEVSGAEWFSWEEGLAKLSFENERKVVEQARRIARGEGGAAGPEEIRSTPDIDRGGVP